MFVFNCYLVAFVASEFSNRRFVLPNYNLCCIIVIFFIPSGLCLEKEFPLHFDVSCWPKMRARFTEVFATKTREEWVEIFKSKDACFAPVLGLDEAASNSHNIARDSFTQNRISKNDFPEPRPAPKLSRTPAQNRLKSQPAIGEHTVEVLIQEGFSDLEVEQLIKEDVIKQYVPSSSL